MVLLETATSGKSFNSLSLNLTERIFKHSDAPPWIVEKNSSSLNNKGHLLLQMTKVL